MNWALDLSNVLATAENEIRTCSAARAAHWLIRFGSTQRTNDEYVWMAGIMADQTLDWHMEVSYAIVRQVMARVKRTHRIAAVCGLYSGGNDSTTFMDLFQGWMDYAVHVDTTIGIPETREHVEWQCEKWGVELIVEQGNETYEELVMRLGFPGAGGHGIMYQQLKERALRKVRKRIIGDRGRRERVIFLNGVRHMESNRRMKTSDLVRRDRSVIWLSPIAWWSSAHLREYRDRYNVELNEVSANLHMSGECLCGAFAKPGELEQIRFFYPNVAALIEELEVKVAEAGHARCRWGQRGPNTNMPELDAGPICQKCEADG